MREEHDPISDIQTDLQKAMIRICKARCPKLIFWKINILICQNGILSEMCCLSPIFRLLSINTVV